MRKRILIALATLLVAALGLHFFSHRSGSHGVMESLRKSVHGE
jgi:hypothetical protein